MLALALADSLRYVSAIDVPVGRFLGSGGFSDVFQIMLDTQPRALKRLRCTGRGSWSHAIEDLKQEVRILVDLPSHANIVELIAVSEKFWQSPERGFIVLELVEETLYERLGRWRSQRSMIPRLSLFRTCQEKRRQEQRDRLRQCTVGVADALLFLHNRGIVYRDLKPANIGFAGDTVKLMDFGLARSVKHQNDGLLIGSAGTARYMAPECASGIAYGFPIDIYSFALLLWETATLDYPFASASNAIELRKLYIRSNVRPPIRRVVSKPLQDLIQASWDANPDIRPSAALLRLQLNESLS